MIHGRPRTIVAPEVAADYEGSAAVPSDLLPAETMPTQRVRKL